MTVFEYGSGNSTFWWAARVNQIVSVEHHRAWYDQLVPRVPKNVQMLCVELDDSDRYASTPLRLNELFDVIVIDGRDRVRCAQNAVNALKPDGVIVFDDLENGDFREGQEFLVNRGFRELPFCGVGPISTYCKKTVVFYRPDNCFGI